MPAVRIATILVAAEHAVGRKYHLVILLMESGGKGSVFSGNAVRSLCAGRMPAVRIANILVAAEHVV